MRVSFLRAVGAGIWAGFLSCSAIFVESPEGEPPQYCTAFNHFPKSGGTSIKSQLMANCRVESSRMPGLITGMLRTTSERPLDIVHNSSVIMGGVEILRVSLEDAGRNCDYFTMVRHPIDRLVSAFYFCPTDKAIPQNRPEKWCGNAEGQTGSLQERLLDFCLQCWGNTAFRRMMYSFNCDSSFELCHPDLARDTLSLPHNIDTPEGRQMMDERQGMEMCDDSFVDTMVTQTSPSPFGTECHQLSPVAITWGLGVLSTYTAVGIMEEWGLSMELFNAKVKSPVRR